MNEILKITEGQNTGFIAAPPKPSDWIAGAETGIIFEDRIGVDCWCQYLPSPETQKKAGIDMFACVTFSACNSVETQIDWMRAKGLLPQDAIDQLGRLGFWDANGKFNASDRFTAKMSGTTSLGNTLGEVWQSIRRDGLVPEADWPFIEGMSWEQYYAEIPQELKDKAKEFLKIFNITYELVGFGNLNYTPATEIRYHLKQAPLQIAAPVCWPWNTSEPIQKCGVPNAGHATLLHKLIEAVEFDIYDHYDPYNKKLAWDYNIPYVMKGVVALRQPLAPLTLKYSFTADIEMGERSAGVATLQTALTIDGQFSRDLYDGLKSKNQLGYYGEITRAAVRQFQFKYKVAGDTELQGVNGRRVGSKTRSKLNELFS